MLSLKNQKWNLRPKAPQNLTVSNVATSSATLEWSGSGGAIMVNDERLTETELLTYELENLESETNYTVSIVNEHGESNKVEFQTLPKTVTTIEDFANITNWKLQSSATETSVSIDTVNTLSGQSLKLTANNGTDIAFVKNSNIDLTLAVYDAFELAVFVEDIRKIENFIFFIGNDIALANRGTVTYRQSNLKAGWNQLSIPLDTFVTYGEFDITQAIKAIQLRIKSTDVDGTSVSIDRIDLIKD